MVGDDLELVLTALNALQSAVSALHAHAEKTDDTKLWTGAKDPSLDSIKASLKTSEVAIRALLASNV